MAALTTDKGPIYDPGLCRCCGNLKKCRILNVEYISLGKKELYMDMLIDCFGVILSNLDSGPTDRLICASCVHRLRDSYEFKQQVLKCEDAFLQARLHDQEVKARDVTKIETPEIEVKLELIEMSEDRPSGSPFHDTHDDSQSDIKSESRKSDTNSVEDEDRPLIDLVKTLDPARQELRIDKNSKATNHTVSKQISMSVLQQRIRERDPTYLMESNTLTIMEFSYVCPFKCRHNHLLCYFCGDVFADPSALREHTLSTHNPKKFKIVESKKMIKVDLTRIDCRLCSMKIDSLDEFKRHITTAHKKRIYDIKDMLLPFRLSKNEIKCALCDLQFPYFHALNKHMNEHYSNFVCETCGLGFVDRARFLMHQQRHDQTEYPCEICGKSFRAAYNKDLHIDRVHNRRGRIYCPKCDVRLMTYPQKLKHLVEVHGEQPMSFTCNLCEKVFETRRTLTTHRRKIHLKDYRYECQICGQKFFTRFALTNHMPTHTGERNFKCKVCEKSYPRLKTLKDHIRIHTNDRRYRCHICGQAFIQNCSLKGHMKSQHPEYI
ncbi:zinc finger protein 260-like isoform X1 [Leptidea sinapis]|uniref:zinc finger protein 260-like isoform X1 n=1 Tax=Leptidea sinapis TaxID=189913 RepID=UPI0021C2567C|nr:zinc finger protein 260-like isoform X1 [Leptidea sinapis]